MSERTGRHPPAQYARRHSMTRFREPVPDSANDNKDEQTKEEPFRFAAYPALTQRKTEINEKND